METREVLHENDPTKLRTTFVAELCKASAKFAERSVDPKAEAQEKRLEPLSFKDVDYLCWHGLPPTTAPCILWHALLGLCPRLPSAELCMLSHFVYVD